MYKIEDMDKKQLYMALKLSCEALSSRAQEECKRNLIQAAVPDIDHALEQKCRDCGECSIYYFYHIAKPRTGG